MLSAAALHSLAASLTSLLLDHNPIACLPLNLRCCTVLALLSCCHARLSYVRSTLLSVSFCNIMDRFQRCRRG